MNRIIASFLQGKLVKSVDDLVDLLFEKFGGRSLNQLPKDMPLCNKCSAVGYRVAEFEYAQKGIPLGAVPDKELSNYALLLSRIYQAIILAGDVKYLHLIRKDAAAFINATGFSQELSEDFFIENFTKPVVLYTDSYPLFDDVMCIVVFYDSEVRKVNCLFAKRIDKDHTQEYGGCVGIDDLSGKFSKCTIEVLHKKSDKEPMMRQIMYESKDTYFDTLYNSMLYAFKFVMLLHSDKQPIFSERQHKKHRDPKRELEIRGYLDQQVVSLTTKYVQAMRAWKPTDTVKLEQEGKIQKTIEVHGFVRRQHYGAGNSMIKYVYIDNHDRQAWVKEGIRIIHVVP